MYRRYELSKLPGTVVSIETAAQRRALVGKRVAFDTSRSIFMQRGTVTGTHGRSLSIDDRDYPVHAIEQIAITEEGE